MNLPLARTQNRENKFKHPPKVNVLQTFYSVRSCCGGDGWTSTAAEYLALLALSGSLPLGKFWLCWESYLISVHMYNICIRVCIFVCNVSACLSSVLNILLLSAFLQVCLSGFYFFYEPMSALHSACFIVCLSVCLTVCLSIYLSGSRGFESHQGQRFYLFPCGPISFLGLTLRRHYLRYLLEYFNLPRLNLCIYLLNFCLFLRLNVRG